jgi:hypothetical protein
MRTEIRGVGESHQSGISHQIADSPMQVRSCMVEILSFLDTDEIGDLGGVKGAAVTAHHGTGTALAKGGEIGPCH